MAVETNKLVLVSVDESGAVVAVNGENRRVDWGELRRAAGQDDKDLAAAYRAVLADAERVASHGPVDIWVDHDHTNVWWVVFVRAVWGGGSADFRRDADECGTHAAYSSAAFEARAIAKRLGKRVRSLKV